ncbi:MAG: GTPase ObgE [Candidatus Sumerlaeia bacterium]|nr:GTPase ObgE [Candidatus Sumerlaeia bacterium]
MFVDYAKIHVKAGDGGDGCISFRREKYVPRGGPNGGDGGNGGNIYIEADPHLHTLIDFKYKPHFKARRGEHGRGKNQSGKNGEDVIIRVPCGTVIKSETGEIIADLTKPGERVLVAKGGRGGRGNQHFASSTNQTPRWAEPGEPGEEKWLILELKMLADVGLVGFPNAGKSTFLSAVTPATPKIAPYPFTTLHPNLGVYVAEENYRVVFADIPGIIEDASKGMGLGDKFLRHIERTRLLVFLLFDDLGNFDFEQLWHQFTVLRKELEAYSSELGKKPYVIAINKIDLASQSEVITKVLSAFQKAGHRAFAISAREKIGLNPLLEHIVTTLKELDIKSPVNPQLL